MFCSVVGKRIELILFPLTYLVIYDRRLDFIAFLRALFWTSDFSSIALSLGCDGSQRSRFRKQLY